MKIPLLLSANPRLANAPRIFLDEGDWEIESDQVDSEITLNSLSSSIEVKNGAKFHSVGQSFLVDVKQIGSEKSLTIFAKKL